MLVRLALHQLDRVVDQVRVEVLDLLLGELDLLESGDDLVVGEKPLLQTVLNELVKLFDVGKRDVDGEQLDLPGFACGLLADLTQNHKSRTPTPGSPLVRSDVTREDTKPKQFPYKSATTA